MLITIPRSFSSEIRYSFEILMGEFLGIDLQFEISDKSLDFMISEDRMKPIVIKNQFFSHTTESLGYCSASYLPFHIQYWSDPSLSIDQLPIIYGAPKLEISEDRLVLHADIISSTFFMLSRWEEVIDTRLDIHQRVLGINSIAYKYNFLHRPVVNEYADLLWSVLLKSGYQGIKKQHVYQATVTHDVDQPYQWPDWVTGIKHLGGDLVKRKNLSLAFTNFKSLIDTKINKQPDPYDQFQFLLQLAEKHQVKAHFNFIVSKSSKFDQSMPVADPRLKTLINTVASAGHIIGYHPSYNVYLDRDKFNDDLTTLQKLSNQKITTGRQHYLRFKVPDTWRLWEQAGMEWESSMGYADTPGFRCGTCYTYSLYDCILRKKLNLKEKPLILMDATLVYYLKNWDLRDLYSLKNQCKKHGGEWVTVWHNDLVKNSVFRGMVDLFYG